MEKTFRQLSVTDKIHVIIKNKKLIADRDKYGNVYHDGIIHSEIEINSIHLKKGKDGESDIVRFNEERSYNEIRYALEVCKSIDKSSFETETHIYFTDESNRDLLLKEMAINEIKKYEESLRKFETQTKRNIEEVRKNYFRVLNQQNT